MEVSFMTLSTKKRPTIAFFSNSLEEDYTETLGKGIIEAAEEKDVNLIILSGETLKMGYTGRYNYNVVYEYVSHQNVDALVIASSVLCQCVTNDEFKEFCYKYKPLPVVSIGVPVEGIPSVLINSRTGLKKVIDHLIKDHHRRRIAFVKGPEGHPEAEERFDVYRETLKENGIDYDPDLVVPGDFTINQVENSMKILLDERKASVDAIVAASDAMAFGVLESLRNRNIVVPDEISVTGFDDGEGAKYSNPSLTTVKQPIREYTKKALEIALDYINGNQPHSVVLDTEMVLRESCGCFSEAMQSFNIDNPLLGLNPDKQPKLETEWLSNLFIRQNFENSDIKEMKLSFLQPFVINCFQVFLGDSLDWPEIEKLLRYFEVLVDVRGLKGNDILTIQKIFTNLHKLLKKHVKDNNSLLVEDFFQRLRVLITDMLIKIHGNSLKSHHQDIRHLRELMVEMVSKINNYHEQARTIIPRMRVMGINHCYIFLYDKPIMYQMGGDWINPPIINLAMAYNKEDWVLPNDGQKIRTEEIFNNEWLPQDKRFTMMFYPLFVEEEHLGLILFEFNMPNIYMFESLVVEISCAIKLSLLFYEREQIDTRLQEVVRELEDYNQKLSNISQTDELTGLYNRRGFLNLAKQSLNLARKREKNGLLFYADMDGLKMINDQYGHDEGDVAIKAMGNVLVKTFRASDIISRLGGDEFTILAVDSTLESLPKIEERLQKYLNEYNSEVKKPYQLSITIGAVAFDSTESIQLEELMNKADNMLYEKKRAKKKEAYQESD